MGLPGQGAGLGFTPSQEPRVSLYSTFGDAELPRGLVQPLLAPPRSSGSLADVAQGTLQPDKQTPVELEPKLKEAGGQCPPREMREESTLAEGAQLAPEAVCWGWE